MDGTTLAELGMASDLGPSNHQEVKIENGSATYVSVDNEKDYFVEKDGQKFAGTHLLVELWEAIGLETPEGIDRALCGGALRAKATILHSHFHHFQPNGGVSGVVVLAESHISIHTWPERAFAAIDIFMCGDCDPYDAIPEIEAYFKPGRVEVSEHRRGLLP